MAKASESIPILIFHKGNSPYLRDCLVQARKTNPSSRLILLGDKENECLAQDEALKGLEHFDADSFPGFKEFLPIYRHCSFLNYNFEIVCIQRWFVMRDWARQFGVKRFLHLDSDVLLFCNVTELAQRFDKYDMTFMRWDADRLLAHFFLLNRIEFLDEFCEYILKIYQNDSEFERLVKRSMNENRVRQQDPWISDMSLLAGFYDVSGCNAYFLENAREEGLFFDDRITLAGSFQKEFGILRKHKIKKVRFLDGHPFVFTQEGKPMEVQMLHFHSFTKFLMPYFERGQNPHWLFFWYTLILEHKMVKRFMKKGIYSPKILFF